MHASRPSIGRLLRVPGRRKSCCLRGRGEQQSNTSCRNAATCSGSCHCIRRGRRTRLPCWDSVQTRVARLRGREFGLVQQRGPFGGTTLGASFRYGLGGTGQSTGVTPPLIVGAGMMDNFHHEITFIASVLPAFVQAGLISQPAMISPGLIHCPLSPIGCMVGRSRLRFARNCAIVRRRWAFISLNWPPMTDHWK